MSSLVRRIQIRAWKRKAKKPFNHDGKHGGMRTVDGASVPRLRWPLLAKNFNEEQTA